MIRLFRKIRHQLLGENKYSIYILYASGEIFLVMVGILLALQVNNWNEKRIEKQKIDLGLIALEEAMYEDSLILNTGRKIAIFRTFSLQYLLKQAGHPNYFLDSIQLNNLTFEKSEFWNEDLPDSYDRSFINAAFSWSGRYSIMSLNRQVINELESTGIYSQIENKELKRLINAYYQEINWRLDASADRMFTRSWDEYLVKRGVAYYDISMVEDPIGLIAQDPEASAHVVRLIQESRFRASSVIYLLEQNKAIIQAIRYELSRD